MSGTLKIKFPKSEITKIKNLLGKISQDNTIFPPNFKEIHPDSKSRGLHVEFEKGLLSFDYAIWDQYSKAWATFLGQELIKHFKFSKVGWDSIGWVTTEEFKNAKGLILLGNFEVKVEFLRKRMKEAAEKLIKENL